MFKTQEKENPTPFSKRKVIYENENVVLPEDTDELQHFIDVSLLSAGLSVDLNFPTIRAVLPSKNFFESLYNRLNNDLLLWEPMAPQPHVTAAAASPEAAANSILIPSR